MFSSMHTKFEIKDKTGRMLRMTDWNWRHIIKKHPENLVRKRKDNRNFGKTRQDCFIVKRRHGKILLQAL